MSEPAPQTPKRSYKTAVLLTIALLGVVGLISMKMFSTVVYTKFASAKHKVSSDVVFGGPNDYRAPSGSAPVVQKELVREVREGERSAQELREAREELALQKRLAASNQEPMVEAPKDAPEQEVKVNEATSTAQDRFSTFSIDVDTGSYTQARRALTSGYLPTASAVRVEEFVNYFGYNYPAPDKEPFAVSMEGAPSPFSAEPNTYLLRVGVQGRQLAPKERKPTHLTFLVDVSGSMSGPDRIELAKRAMGTLVKNLRPQDSVAIVTYAGSNEVALADTAADAKGKAKILAAIDELNTGGGTAMGSGMELAYKQAARNAKGGHISRVVVISDGDANIGPVSYQEILDTISGHVQDGITMTTVGFGNGNYQDTMMEQLANKGNGNYYYIDGEREAERIFNEQIGGTLEVIAKDVKIQVEFNPAMVKSYRLVGYENRDIRDQDFRNDKVDAGEIGSGHTVTALYELTTAATLSEDLAYVRIRHKQPDGHNATEQSFTLRPVDMRAKLKDGSADLQFAAAVAMFAEKLRGSKYAANLSFDLIREIAQSAMSPNQVDRAELITLIDEAKALQDHGWR